MAKHYHVVIKYDDPYPREYTINAIEATSAGRAAYLGEKQWRKTRPRKREPNILHFTIVKL